MKAKLTLLLALTVSAYTLCAAPPDQITVTLSSEDKLGLQHVTEQYNLEAKARHDAEQAAKPEAERVAYVALTEEQYAHLRLAEVFKSWTALYTQYRMNLPENREFFEKATVLPEAVKEQIKALIQASSSQ